MFEFSAYSQNGEDGIIDFLIEVLGLDTHKSGYPRAFIEFGVQDYRESNTRYLLKRRHFQGLVLDSSPKYIQTIRNDSLFWQYDLEAKQAFITKENINPLIQEWLDSRGLKNVALLSIDIDGVDYYVWEAITCISPAVVVIEYNALLEGATSVPYDEKFERFKAHFSGLYFGASLNALRALGHKKGYCFVGVDRSGSNAFFVSSSLQEKLSHIHSFAPNAPYSPPVHHTRQARDKNGNLSFTHGVNRSKLIAHLPLCKV